MIVEQLKSTTVITQEKKTISELVIELNKIYGTIESNNIIINLFSLDTAKASDLKEFTLLSQKHRGAKHSFVIVNKAVNLDEVSEELIVVPTLIEAHDLIEMEEIERDLGF